MTLCIDVIAVIINCCDSETRGAAGRVCHDWHCALLTTEPAIVAAAYAGANTVVGKNIAVKTGWIKIGFTAYLIYTDPPAGPYKNIWGCFVSMFAYEEVRAGLFRMDITPRTFRLLLLS